MKSYRILSIEACDIYEHEQTNGKAVGYRLLPKNDDNYFEQYQNKLDYSLDTIELKRVYEQIIGPSFSFRDKYGNEYTQAVINVKFKINSSTLKILQLRDYFYKNGFCVDGVRYVRYKRSAGSSRTGKCLFIDERLYGAMAKWSECGLSPSGDLASWEAYKSLSLSSVKGTVNIPAEGILFVPDFKSTFTDEVIAVELDDGNLVAGPKKTEVENDIWDGESLLDESLFAENYSDKHMLLLRNKFFKSCAFRTKLQKWIKDKGITLEDLRKRGVTLATDINQIVMVTTPNSLKYLKFVGGLSEVNILQWASHVDSAFGVVKWDKRPRFFNGRMVSSSYQLFNTVGLNGAQVEEKLQPSKNYLTTIWHDVDFMRYHFTDVCKKEDDDCGDDWNYDWDSKDGEDSESADGIEKRAEIIFGLMNANSDFECTQLYKEFRLDVRQGQERLIKSGRILLRGTNATLFGNGPELLKYIAGEKVEPTLQPGQIRCERFNDGQELLCARSPHITMGNLYLVKNNLDGDIWNYFVLGENIVCVNAIGENIQQRLNGCDYDSDTMLITDDKMLIETVEKYEHLFKVPVCKIASQGTANYTLAELDYNTSVNKIGEIVNLSQKLNSIIWDRLNSGSEDIGDIYLDVCKLAVLSGLEIDKAKRAYDDIDVRKELEHIRKKHKCPAPKFFELIGAKSKKKRESGKEKEYAFHKTSMDYIYQSSKINFQQGKKKYAKHVTILSMLNVKPQDNDADIWQCKEIIEKLEQYNKKIVWRRMLIQNADDDEKKVLYENILDIKKDRDEEVFKLITNKNVLVLTLKYFEDLGTNNTNFYDPLLCTKMFFDILNKSEQKLATIEEDPSGEHSLYGFKYTKK